MRKFLSKSLYGVWLWWFCLPFFVGLVLLVIGSFFDLTVSQTIADQDSPFGVFFEGWGMLLPFTVGTFGGMALATGLFKQEKKRWKTCGILAALLAVGVMGYMTGRYMTDPFSGNTWITSMGGVGKALAYGVGYLLQIGIAVLAYFLYRKQNGRLLIVVGLFFVLWIAFEVGGIELFKKTVYRPRFRWLYGFVYDENGVRVYAPIERGSLYRDWFASWQWFSKAAYSDSTNPITYAEVNDSIQSFPSGHTAFGSVMTLTPLLLSTFGLGQNRLKRLQPICFVLGFAFVLVLAYSRIRVGAHFMSDTGMAMMVTSLLSFIGLWIGSRFQEQKE